MVQVTLTAHEQVYCPSLRNRSHALSSCLSRMSVRKDIHSETWLALHRKPGIKQDSLVIWGTLHGNIALCYLCRGWKGVRPCCWNGVTITIIHCNLISDHIISPVQQQSLKGKRGEHELSSIDRSNSINKSFTSIINQLFGLWRLLSNISTLQKEHLKRLVRWNIFVSPEYKLINIYSGRAVSYCVHKHTLPLILMERRTVSLVLYIYLFTILVWGFLG